MPRPEKPAEQAMPVPPELFVAVCEVLQEQPWIKVHKVLAALMAIRPVNVEPKE